MKGIEIFQSESGAIEFRGDGEHETVWAIQKQVAMLFGTKVPAINKHIKNILLEEELDLSTISKMETAQVEGKREVKSTVGLYNLDMIIAIGYRVNSKLATEFRKWVTSILKKYLINGYAINEKKLSTTKELRNNLKATIDFLASKEIAQEKEILSQCEALNKEFMEFAWTYRILDNQIDNKSYEKFLLNQTNFDNTMVEKYKHQAVLAVKDEYNFSFLEVGNEYSERELEIGLYLSALNDTIKLEDENPAIGIIICKDKKRTTVEYSLKDSNQPIGVATYKLTESLPSNLKDLLPSSQEIGERLISLLDE